MEATELKSIIANAIRQLPEKQQRIYRMSREQGMSHEEIGTTLQVSHRTVSNTLSLTLGYLRNTLRGLGYLPAVTTLLYLPA
jgi:RNA polymerase sigma factor (sigma-70 family)